jgi:hypothetical protein
LLIGRSDGTFQSGATIASVGGPVAVDAFDRDGTLDVAIATIPNVELLTGNGDGTFRAP